MPKYRIYVPMTFDDVYLVEAESIEEAKMMWHRGDVSYEESFLFSTDTSELDHVSIDVEEADYHD